MKKSLILLALALLVTLVLSSCASLASGTPTVVGGWKMKGEGYTETLWFTDTGRYVCEYEEEDYIDIEIHDYEYIFFANSEPVLYLDDERVWDFSITGKTMVLDGNEYKRITRSAKDNSSGIRGTWKGEYFKMAFISNGTFIFDGQYKNNGQYRLKDGELHLDDDYELDYLIVNNTLYLENDFRFSSSDYLKFERTSSAGTNSATLSFVITYGPWTYVSEDHDYEYVYAIYPSGRYEAVKHSYLTGTSSDVYSGTYKFENIYIYLSGGLNRTLTIAYVDEVLFGYSY